ncbi:MAG: insulinase family protein, partial [Clostridia bacterium]|nr:insulinase family protein [Clostridia bacterium]
DLYMRQVISMAGNIDVALAEELVEKYFSDLPYTPADNKPVDVKLCGQALFCKKDIEQIHLALAFPSVKRYDKLFDATQIMNSVFGGSMSSRLFQKVREELGLAYTVYSYVSPYAEAGSLVIYAGVNAENYLTSAEAVLDCVRAIKSKDLTEEEFLRGKEQLLSSSIFSQESTSSQMLLYGKELIYSGKVYDFEERVKKINSVTLSDVLEAVEYNFDSSRLASAVVGNVTGPLKL